MFIITKLKSIYNKWYIQANQYIIYSGKSIYYIICFQYDSGKSIYYIFVFYKIMYWKFLIYFYNMYKVSNIFILFIFWILQFNLVVLYKRSREKRLAVRWNYHLPRITIVTVWILYHLSRDTCVSNLKDIALPFIALWKYSRWLESWNQKLYRA